MQKSFYPLNIAELQKVRGTSSRQPFPHQQEAFAALSKTFTTPMTDYIGSMLVLPTGGGKTYTAVSWLCRNVLSRNIKLLWIAPQGYLIDQAYETLYGEIHNAAGRECINIRVVSSSSKHANAGTIASSDDVIFCTTQTAIAAYSRELLDGSGMQAYSPFHRFVDNCKKTQLFVVVDEAHHTPAYGCRSLLLSLREHVPNLYVLGLTATPTHSDKRIKGWLQRIYTHGKDGVCYKAEKDFLITQKILAKPEYIERQTREEYEVDDTLYDRLVHKHINRWFCRKIRV